MNLSQLASLAGGKRAAQIASVLRTALFRARAIPYLGSRYVCPCCGWRFRQFLPYGLPPRPNAKCPRCNALERHRALWLYLSTKTDLFTARRRVLHVAPEPALQSALSAAPNIEYVTADMQSPYVMVKLDVENIPYPDGAFDVVLCNHVLEHVADDRRAMREIRRVLSPGGWAVLLAPMDDAREVTFEDPTVVDPKERERVFGQKDHVRIYGRDYIDRLREAGFAVERIPFPAIVEPALAARHGVLASEDIIIGRRQEDARSGAGAAPA